MKELLKLNIDAAGDSSAPKDTMVLNTTQFERLYDGFCPECDEPLDDGACRPCPACGAGPFDGEIFLDLSDAVNVRICIRYTKK